VRSGLAGVDIDLAVPSNADVDAGIPKSEFEHVAVGSASTLLARDQCIECVRLEDLIERWEVQRISSGCVRNGVYDGGTDEGLSCTMM